jgi:hypothetical protein
MHVVAQRVLRKNFIRRYKRLVTRRRQHGYMTPVLQQVCEPEDVVVVAMRQDDEIRNVAAGIHVVRDVRADVPSWYTVWCGAWRLRTYAGVVEEKDLYCFAAQCGLRNEFDVDVWEFALRVVSGGVRSGRFRGRGRLWSLGGGW